MPTSPSAVFPLEGPLRLDPGRCGPAATFAFVNVSPWPICDLRITTWDSDALGATPEILPDRGVRITTFTPTQLPGDRIGVGNETLLSPSAYTRSNDDEESDETYIAFENGNCIQPGMGFTLNLRFDESLDGNEGIDISPSRTLDGEHYSIGSSIAEPPGPLTWTELLEILGKIGAALPIGALLAQTESSSQSSDTLAAAAIRGALVPEYAATTRRGLARLPVKALAGLNAQQREALASMGLNTVKDLATAPVVLNAQLLVALGGRRKR